MQVDHAVNVVVKRSQDSGEEDLSASSPKRLKIKSESDEQVNGSIPTKPPSRGVETIQYPAECRPTNRAHVWHRQEIIKDNKERLALLGRRVTTTRFLDDGICFDWILDREACNTTNERISTRPLVSRHEATANLTKTFNQHQRHEKSSRWKGEDQYIPGLHFHNSGITINIQEGTIANPILIQDDCNVILKSEEESSVSHKGPEEETSNVVAVDSVMSLSDTDISNDMANTLTSEAPKSSAASCSNVEGVRNGGIEEKSSGDKPTGLSIYTSPDASSRSATSSSPSSSSSSSSSSESESEDAFFSAKRPSVDNHNSQCACSAHENLKGLNWKNSMSTLVIKNLAPASRTDEIYNYLQLNGFSSSEIRDLRLYSCPTDGPFASIEFLNPQEAAKAKRTMETLNVPFPPPFASKKENGIVEVNVRIEQCKPPVWWDSRMASGHDKRKPETASLPVIAEGTTKSTLSTQKIGTRAAPCTARPISKGPASQAKLASRDVVEVTSDSDEDDNNESSSSSSASDSDSDPDSDTSITTEGRNLSGSRSTHVNNHVTLTGRVCEVQLPKVKHGRGRRLLLPLSSANPLMTCTIRGDVQFVNQTTKKRLSRLSLPAEESNIRKLEDACIANETAVLGFSKDDASQASVVGFVDESRTIPKIFPLRKKPHLHKGILSLAPVRKREYEVGRSFEFLSGGYDKTVQHWHVTPTRGDEGHIYFSSRAHSISRGCLNTQVNALVHHQGTSQVLAAAGQRLWTLDIESRSPLSYTPFSNHIHQLHVQRKMDPNVIIIEVDHLLNQMQVFDVRAARPGSGKPIMEFGYVDSTSPHTRAIRSRKRRGDTSMQYFSRGYHDGTVCRWDYRKISEPMIVGRCSSPVTHTVFAGRNIWAFAGDKVRHIELYAEQPKART